MIAALQVAMALPGLTIGLAWFLHEREHHVLSGQPVRETAGRHRRVEGTSR